MFFKRSNDSLQKATIDEEGLRHVKERHIELYDLVRNRFAIKLTENEVYDLIKQQLKEAKEIGFDDDFMILRNDGTTMVVTKDTGKVIGTRGETHITLVLRDNLINWRLVTAFPKVIEEEKVIDNDDEYEEKIFYSGLEMEEEDDDDFFTTNDNWVPHDPAQDEWWE